MAGLLVIAGTPLGDPRDASPRLADELATADVVAAEDTRRLRRLAARPRGRGLRTGRVLLRGATRTPRTPSLVRELGAGARVLLVTDAGMPSVSDPGYRLVAAAVGAGVRVTCRPRAVGRARRAGPLGAARGPVLLRGVPAPQGGRAQPGAVGRCRTSRARWCSSRRRTGCGESLPAMADAFGPDRPAAVCRELTKTYEEVRRGPLAELAAWAADGVRGEITVVVSGAAPRDSSRHDDDGLAALVAERVAARHVPQGGRRGGRGHDGGAAQPGLRRVAGRSNPLAAVVNLQG